MKKKIPAIKLKPIKLLCELRSSEPGYAEWLAESALNLGWDEKEGHSAYGWLEINATETNEEGNGEEGVVQECNAIRKMVEQKLNSNKGGK